jgi:hypothetical protein
VKVLSSSPSTTKKKKKKVMDSLTGKGSFKALQLHVVAWVLLLLTIFILGIGSKKQRDKILK